VPDFRHNLSKNFSENPCGRIGAVPCGRAYAIEVASNYFRTFNNSRYNLIAFMPKPVAARYKAWVCGRSLAGISGLNLPRGIDVFLL